MLNLILNCQLNLSVLEHRNDIKNKTLKKMSGEPVFYTGDINEIKKKICEEIDLMYREIEELYLGE